MNQRPAKTHRAAMPGEGNITIGQLRDFCKTAAGLLDENDPDAAFYFEQIAEHLTRSPQKGLNESVHRILGL